MTPTPCTPETPVPDGCHCAGGATPPAVGMVANPRESAGPSADVVEGATTTRRPAMPQAERPAGQCLRRRWQALLRSHGHGRALSRLADDGVKQVCSASTPPDAAARAVRVTPAPRLVGSPSRKRGRSSCYAAAGCFSPSPRVSALRVAADGAGTEGGHRAGSDARSQRLQRRQWQVGAPVAAMQLITREAAPTACASEPSLASCARGQWSRPVEGVGLAGCERPSRSRETGRGRSG